LTFKNFHAIGAIGTRTGSTTLGGKYFQPTKNKSAKKRNTQIISIVLKVFMNFLEILEK
jgi:hypothetical protein